MYLCTFFQIIYSQLFLILPKKKVSVWEIPDPSERIRFF